MSFDALPHACWPEVAAALTQPWPSAAAAHDLRWHAAEHHVSGRRLPSERDLAERWGWHRSKVQRLLLSRTWVDAARPWGWRKSEPPPSQDRATTGQSGTVEGQESETFEPPPSHDRATTEPHARNSFKHPTPYTPVDTILRPAAAVAPPASPPPVELFLAPPPEPDPAPAPSAKPTREPKPDPVADLWTIYRGLFPRSRPTASPDNRKALSRILAECGDAETATTYLRWVAEADEEWAARLRGDLPWPDGSVVRRCDPVSLSRSIPARLAQAEAWAERQRSPADAWPEILTRPLHPAPRRSAQQEKADTLEWIAAARAKLAAQK